MNALERAAQELRAGGLVVVPTDTVYGVAVHPQVPGAVQKLFATKGRPRSRALPVLGASVPALETVAELDETSRALAGRFWPGPLTLVVPRAPGFTSDLGGDDDGSVGVRIPSHAVARELLNMTGPLATTSANLSDRPPAVTVEDARAALGEAIGIYLDGGRCDGPASTVVTLIGTPRVLRKGPISLEQIQNATS